MRFWPNAMHHAPGVAASAHYSVDSEVLDGHGGLDVVGGPAYVEGLGIEALPPDM